MLNGKVSKYPYDSTYTPSLIPLINKVKIPEYTYLLPQNTTLKSLFSLSLLLCCTELLLILIRE